MVNPIDIHDITLEELSGVISLYPWYGGARMELCRRMAEAGVLSGRAVAETALHLCDRTRVTSLLRTGHAVDYTDRGTRQMVEAFLPDASPEKPATRVVVVGGDYFSQDQYEGIRKEGDGVFSRFAVRTDGEGDAPVPADVPDTAPNDEDFCTETLAGIYLEQGYTQEAVDIYSRLSLRYPEKSIYFATLIDEINRKEN